MATVVKSRLAESVLQRIYTLLVVAAALAVLAVARDLCIPIALAALLTFLMAPMVTRLERWLGRIAAVLLVLILLSITVTGVGYVLSQQLMDLTSRLPEYHASIEKKIVAFQESTAGRYSRFSRAIEVIRLDLPGATPPPTSVKVGAAGSPAPMTVTMVEPDGTTRNTQSVIVHIMNAFALASLVILITVFMLLHREDVRGRIIRLAGHGRISLATTAMQDAGARVFRYLVMQLVVNAGFGLAVATGLYVIGIPNAVLWGALAAALRFIPYVGAWIAAALPMAMALAVDGWTMLLLTAGLFLLLEIITCSVMEPWLYAVSTGVSSLALILAALFWGWMWGPIGLVLATPLTVCLVVVGRHIPRMSFLSVLLSDDQPLTPHEECYHRLLRSDLTEATALIDRHLKTRSLTSLYDEVLIPVLITAEADHGLDELDGERRAALHQSVRDLLDDVALHTFPATTTPAKKPLAGDEPAAAGPRILCLPVRAVRDELAAVMLTHLLRQQGCDAHELTAKETAGEMVEAVAQRPADAVCISVVTPSAAVHARNLCMKLRARLPDLRIVVGFWGAADSQSALAQAFHHWSGVEVKTSLAQACVALTDRPAPTPASAQPALLTPGIHQDAQMPIPASV